MDDEALEVFKDSIKFGKNVFEVLKERGILKKFRDAVLLRPEHYILIFGASGVGKTSMIKCLSGGDPFVNPERRTINVKEHSFELDDFKFTLIDTPGEPTKKDKRIDAIKNVIAKKGASLGVINVVAYGYHEGPRGKYAPIVKGQVNEEYLADCRKQEMNMIAEWVPVLFGGQMSADWIITVITKADLWWTPKKEEEVKNHYSNVLGKYTKSLGDARKGANGIFPLSSIHQRFYDNVPMSGYYTDQQKNSDYWNLITGIFDSAAT